jgi:hypothetical protein
MQEMLRSLVMAVWADGGQGTARRNAWSAMVADAKRARDRADAAVATASGRTAEGVPSAVGH